MVLDHSTICFFLQDYFIYIYDTLPMHLSTFIHSERQWLLFSQIKQQASPIQLWQLDVVLNFFEYCRYGFSDPLFCSNYWSKYLLASTIPHFMFKMNTRLVSGNGGLVSHFLSFCCLNFVNIEFSMSNGTETHASLISQDSWLLILLELMMHVGGELSTFQFKMQHWAYISWICVGTFDHTLDHVCVLRCGIFQSLYVQDAEDTDKMLHSCPKNTAI